MKPRRLFDSEQEVGNSEEEMDNIVVYHDADAEPTLPPSCPLADSRLCLDALRCAYEADGNAEGAEIAQAAWDLILPLEPPRLQEAGNGKEWNV
jgi:hypothetical protein